MDVVIERMRAEDWPAVRAIFAAGIATGSATFEVAPGEWAAWDRSHLADPRLVARTDGQVAGWSALSSVSERAAYSGVAEVSVYVEPSHGRQGIGGLLLAELIERSERAGVWTLQAQIFPENAASLALHARHGFRTVGVRERLGQLRGVWRDVVLLERRSPGVR